MAVDALRGIEVCRPVCPTTSEITSGSYYCASIRLPARIKTKATNAKDASRFEMLRATESGELFHAIVLLRLGKGVGEREVQ